MDEGDKLKVIVPIWVCEDCEWPIGTEVEIVQVRHHDEADAFGPRSYEISDARGIVGSFADIDLEGEYRWFDPVS